MSPAEKTEAPIQAPGATADEWFAFTALHGLGDDLVPVVADRTLQVKDGSNLKSNQIGKVPSVIDRDRVVGLAAWPQRRTTQAEVDHWSSDPRTGFGVITREVRACDIDLEDASQVRRVRDIARAELGIDLPVRSRAGSARVLLVARVFGTWRKVKVRVDEVQAVEFLGDLQMFVACGQHKDGGRYAWSGLDGGIPTVSAEQWRAFQHAVAAEFKAEQSDGLVVDDAMVHEQKAVSLTDEQVADTRAALAYLARVNPKPRYDEWTRNGQACRGMGDVGRELFIDGYSALLDNGDVEEAATKWPMLGGNRSGHAAIIKRAMSAGWVNPRKGASPSADGFELVDVETAETPKGRRQQQKAANALLQLGEPVNHAPPNLTLAEMLSECVYIAAGALVGLKSSPRQALPFNEFKGWTAALVEHRPSSDGRTKALPRADVWKADSSRQTVHTRTFRAGAPRTCFDPEGHISLNTWTPFIRGESKRDPSAFIEQIEYLFSDPDDCRAFLDFLAHIEQRPGELPHFGWLHIAAHHGAGRNWVASILSRVWRGQVAPNVELSDLMESSFNGGIAGRLLAIVDECQVPAGENPYKHANKLKSMVNVETRSVNPKYGKAYLEHNACRWLCFSNFDNALPIDKHDRRFRVARHSALPRPSSTYAHLYGLLQDAEFINAVAVYLGQRDLGMFKPGERPPMSAAKRMAIAATKPLIELHAEELVEHWPADVITNRDLAEVLAGASGATFTPAMRRVMESLGCMAIPRVIKVNGSAARCWAVRNATEWTAAEPAAIGLEVARANRPLLTEAADVLARGRAVTGLQQLQRV